MQGPANFIGFRRSYKLGHTWHKLCRWAIGMKVRYCGNISSATPTLFVANHISYLDIPALGSLLDATFIAKSEIKSWPIFGLLCSLQRTVFIERDWRKALKQREQLYERLDQRDNLILFPEEQVIAEHLCEISKVLSSVQLIGKRKTVRLWYNQLRLLILNSMAR